MCFLRGVCALLEIYYFLSFAEIVYHIIPTLSIGIIEKTRKRQFFFLRFSLPFVFFCLLSVFQRRSALRSFLPRFRRFLLFRLLLFASPDSLLRGEVK